jgi:thiamine monophosphate kinase
MSNRKIAIAVLARAAEDACNGEKLQKSQAIAWFNSGGKDFRLICELADRDPQYVRETMRARLKQISQTTLNNYYSKREINKRITLNRKKEEKVKKLRYLENGWKHARYLKYEQFFKKRVDK